MYIKLTTGKKDNKQVWLVESYRDKNKKTQQRYLQFLGYENDLTKDNPKAILELREFYRNLKKEDMVTLNMNCVPTSNLKKLYEGPIDELASNSRKTHDLGTRNDLELSPVLNIGYNLLNIIYEKLEIGKFIKQITKNLKIEYDPNEALKFHIYSRILNPDSILSRYRDKHQFFESFDVSLNDSYRFLSILYKQIDEFQKYLFDKINILYKRDLSVLLYDVTNYYFSMEEGSGLKEKGVSKEQQLTVLIQMALMSSIDGIPIAYNLFQGNTHDSQTVPTMLKKWLEAFNQKEKPITFIADKGINNAKNMINLDKGGNTYIISQRVKGASKAFRDWVSEANDYVYIGDSFKMKSRIITKTYSYSEKDENGKYKIVEKREINEKQIAFWSMNFEKRELKKINKNINASIKTLGNIGTFKAESARGRNRYLIGSAKNKDGSNAKLTYTLDQDKIEKDILYAGYYAIITNNLEITDNEAIELYRKLTKVEETFKYTKSLLETRPVYVSNEERIQSHFLICYIALILITLLAKEVNDEITDDSNKISLERIIKAMNETTVTKLKSGTYTLNKLSKDYVLISKILKKPLLQEYYLEEQLVKIIK